MIPAILKTQTERAYAAMRIACGFMFTVHGVQKMFGVLGGKVPPVGSQIWIGGLLELVLGAAIVVGLFTAWSAFLSSGMMAVAYTQFHWKFRFDEGIFPAVNRGELALVYAFVFLFIACKGAGIWSVDAKRQAAKAKKA